VGLRSAGRTKGACATRALPIRLRGQTPNTKDGRFCPSFCIFQAVLRDYFGGTDV
jgi:hypothetical protein